MPLNIKNILRRNRALRPYPFIPNAVCYENETPLHKFTSVLAPLKDGAVYVNVTARDSFDETLCNAILQFVDSHSELSLDRRVEICEGFKCDRYEFDSVLVLNGECHNLYATFSEDLQARSLVAFPIMRCEFTGAEAAAEMDHIRHYGPDTIDWNRDASPYVLIQFQNRKTGGRSPGNRLSYRNASIVEREIHKLTEDEESFVELCNFLGQEARITVEAGEFAIRVNGARFAIARSDITQWFGEYLSTGV